MEDLFFILLIVFSDRVISLFLRAKKEHEDKRIALQDNTIHNISF